MSHHTLPYQNLSFEPELDPYTFPIDRDKLEVPYYHKCLANEYHTLALSNFHTYNLDCTLTHHIHSPDLDPRLYLQVVCFSDS